MSVISLIPIVLNKMLRLPKQNKELKLIEADSFITNNGGLRKLLSHFIDSLKGIKLSTY